MNRIDRVGLGAAAVLCALLGCAGEVGRQGLPFAARRCSMRLAGPISGELPCEGALFRGEQGWVLSAVLPAGSRVAGSLLVPLPAGASLAGPELPGARAVLREPTRAGLGVLWGGMPRGHASVALGLDGQPATAELTAVVAPLRANPAEEPVQVRVRMELKSPGYVAGSPHSAAP